MNSASTTEEELISKMLFTWTWLPIIRKYCNFSLLIFTVCMYTFYVAVYMTACSGQMILTLLVLKEIKRFCWATDFELQVETDSSKRHEWPWKYCHIAARLLLLLLSKTNQMITLISMNASFFASICISVSVSGQWISTSIQTRKVCFQLNLFCIAQKNNLQICLNSVCWLVEKTAWFSWKLVEGCRMGQGTTHSRSRSESHALFDLLLRMTLAEVSVLEVLFL